MSKEAIKSSFQKVGNYRINIKSNFADKRLDDILYSIANVKLKEKSV